MCNDDSIFRQYKRDSRLTLDLTKTDRATLDAKRRAQFHYVRAKFDLENKGIDAFSREELKKFADLRVITA